MKIWLRRSEEKDLARQRAALVQDYRLAFATEQGQRVLADILRRCGVMQSTFDAVPAVAAFNEGRRRIGLEIIEMVNADPEAARRLATTGDTEELYRDA